MTPPRPNPSASANAPGGVSAPSPPSPPRSGIARSRLAEQNRTAIVTGILCIVLIIALMQLWLLTATMNAFLGGDHAVVWPALGASIVCLLLNLGLLRYLYLLERP
jgi:hypothetical protein